MRQPTTSEQPAYEEPQCYTLSVRDPAFAQASMSVGSGRRRRRLLLSSLLLASALTGACSDATEPSPVISPPATIGEWSGTTAQGMPIAFTVSADEKVTAITVGHKFGGCSGSQTFTNLSQPTVSDTICVPGPCSDRVTSYRSFSYAEPRFGATQTSVFGLFLPLDRAQGQVNFDSPGCGTAIGVGWTATRR